MNNSKILNAINNLNRPFLTTDVIRLLKGLYTCDLNTYPCYSNNARIGKSIKKLGFQKIGIQKITDDNGNISKSTIWR